MVRDVWSLDASERMSQLCTQHQSSTTSQSASHTRGNGRGEEVSRLSIRFVPASIGSLIDEAGSLFCVSLHCCKKAERRIISGLTLQEKWQTVQRKFRNSMEQKRGENTSITMERKKNLCMSQNSTKYST